VARRDDELIRLRLHLGEFASAELPMLAVRPPLRITAQDRTIIAMLLEGKTEAQVARVRGTSLASTRNRVSAICRKLGVGSREELFRLLGAPAK
jgi:DNA-binding CsgD family transcriptional regulator